MEKPEVIQIHFVSGVAAPPGAWAKAGAATIKPVRIVKNIHQYRFTLVSFELGTASIQSSKPEAEPRRLVSFRQEVVARHHIVQTGLTLADDAKEKGSTIVRVENVGTTVLKDQDQQQ